MLQNKGKTKIILSLILVLAVCFNVTAQTENTPTVSQQKSNSRLAFGIDFPVLVGNSEFSDFMSDHFDMHTPNVLFGEHLSAGWYFSKSNRWFGSYDFNVRSSNRTKNNVTRNWNQVKGCFNFSYLCRTIFKKQNYENAKHHHFGHRIRKIRHSGRTSEIFRFH